MNHSVKFAVLLCLASASMFAIAGGTHSHSSDSDYSWSENGRSLRLHSREGSGVVVDQTTPSPLNGLKAGDVILSIDGHPVAQVNDLVQALHKHGDAPAMIRIRRAGSEVGVTWTHSECQAMFSLALPPPPPPPPPTHI